MEWLAVDRLSCAGARARLRREFGVTAPLGDLQSFYARCATPWSYTRTHGAAETITRLALAEKRLALKERKVALLEGRAALADRARRIAYNATLTATQRGEQLRALFALGN